MSGQLRFLLGYEQLVKNLLQSLPEDDAAAQAVGGNYEYYGVLEHALLRGEGLRDGAAVVDVGCGSGRLATKLARYPGLRYLGLDVVPELLDYARRKAGRKDFRFEQVDEVRLLAKPATVDFCVFFSVFTHILPEESFVALIGIRGDGSFITFVTRPEPRRGRQARLCRDGGRCARTRRSGDTAAACPVRCPGAGAARSAAATRSLPSC